MSAGSHGGGRPDNISSSDWSQYVRPEFRRRVEMEWYMMRRRDLEMDRQNMLLDRDHLGFSIGHINNMQPAANISSLGKRNAEGVQLDQVVELDQAEIDAQNAPDERLETALRAVFKRQNEVNGTTKDVDLTLRMWFQEEKECMNDPNKKSKNA